MTTDNPSSPVYSKRDFSSRIEEISERLNDMVNQTKGLGLSVHIMQQQVHFEAQQSWRESTSLLCEPYVYGRDEEAKRIIHRLLHDEPSSKSYIVIPIVGKAGIGKTTLAQLLYNDMQVNEFDLKAWVHVSQVFDVKRITTTIVNSISGGNSCFNDLNQAQVMLKQMISSKRFLIVLDDVWTEKYEDWAMLRAPFRGGAKGSRIIATTRNKKVARIMNPHHESMVSLEDLSDDDCWRIFLQHAFEDDKAVVSPKFGAMRDDILRKCNGLPLVAKALGGVLRTIVEENEWQEIMRSNNILSMEETDVLRVLLLSYHVLPSHLKRCFGYCSMLPHGYMFKEEEVILMWMAEGLIPENAGEKLMEDFGHEYFHGLVSRSFFEPSVEGSEYFKMHPLISDLARWVAGDVYFARDNHSTLTNQQRVYGRVRHFSLSGTYAIEDTERLFLHEKVSCFRTFMYLDKHPHTNNLTSHLLELIPKFRFIRVLSLAYMRITSLPHSLGHLKLLRYLNLSHNYIMALPESISYLCNLQTLLLEGCDKLERLLQNMRYLIKLRHLDINGTTLTELPLGLGNLTNLQTLQRFIVGAKDGFMLRELKNLKHLRGKLSISGLENVSSVDDAKEAQLTDKSSLEELEFLWGWENFTDGIDDDTRRDVLDELQPPISTKLCTIKNYKGVAFPTWLGDPSFTNMVVMRLMGCDRCEFLPSLGQLPWLKELVVQEMRSVKVVDCDFQGNGCSNSFSVLKTLKFKNMPSWEKWFPLSFNNGGFPCLEDFTIEACPSLQGDLPSHLPSLQTFEIRHPLPSTPLLEKLLIEDCSSLIGIDHLPTSLRQLVISNSQELQHVEFQELYSSDYFGESILLEVVEVVNCQSLSSLFSKVYHQRLEVVADSSTISSEKLDCSPYGTCQFSHLTKLTISGCPNLVTFPKDLLLPSLRNLLISVCENLEALPNQMHNFSSLEDLLITYCPNIHYFPQGGLPLNLVSLYICKVNIEQPIGTWGLHLLTSLEKLSISDLGQSADSIESFPEFDHHLPLSLTALAVSGFPNIRMISCLGVPKLTSLYVRACPKLEGFVDDYLPLALEDLWLVECPLVKQHWDGDSALRSILIRVPHLRIQ